MLNCSKTFDCQGHNHQSVGVNIGRDPTMKNHKILILFPDLRQITDLGLFCICYFNFLHCIALQVAYQKILQLSYMDKFLSDIECEFRDKYKDDLRLGTISRSFDFGDTFQNILQLTEDAHKLEIKVPRLVVAVES